MKIMKKDSERGKRQQLQEGDRKRVVAEIERGRTQGGKRGLLRSCSWESE